MAIDNFEVVDDWVFPLRLPGPRDSLKSLIECTNFSKREIQIMYRSFKQDCPLGICNEEKFREVLSRFFPYGNASFYAQHVFRTLDTNKDKQISFKDLVIWLSQISRGSIEDKIKWIFCLYDINNDGVLTRKEVCDIIISIYSLLGKRNASLSETNLEEKVNQFFDRIGLKCDAAITEEQFLDICTKDKNIQRSVEYLYTVI